MYDGFSGQARKAVQLARGEARRLRQDCVSTGHLLLGVLQEGSEGVTRLLAAFGLDPAAAYRACEPHLPRGSGGPDWDQLPLTPAVKRALAAARQEAAGLGHPCVGPEHLLLGLVSEPDGEAALVLAPLGVAAPRVREELRKGPCPENRDWMLRPLPAGGLPAPADPSARDLEAVVIAEVLPASARPAAAKEQSRPAAVDARHLRRALAAEESLLVTGRQLRALQFAAAAAAGALTALVVAGPDAVVGGLVAGCVVAALRSVVVGAFVGGLAGAACALAHGSDNTWLWACFVILGLLFGGCLGDWRWLQLWARGSPEPADE
jgi:hypothetical protein